MEASARLTFTPSVRRAVPDDLGFIFSTWLKHYKQHSDLTKHITNSVFYVKYHKIIEKLLAKSLVVVAHPPGRPEVILGYAALEMLTPPVVHWVYVKGPWRRFGIARLLLEGLDVAHCSFTHWTRDIESFRERWPTAVYDPYLL